MDSSDDMDFDLDLATSSRQPPDQGGPWQNWTPEERTVITEHFRYYNDVAVYINQRWTNGPDNLPPPKKPEGNIMSLVRTGKLLKPSSKAEMSDDEFHKYLESKLSLVNGRSMSTIDECKNLAEIAKHLQKVYIETQRSESKTLQDHFELGKCLDIAKHKFDAEKRKKKLKLTWSVWIEQNTNIKEACARRHREIFSLTEQYPRLKHLSLSYTDFVQMKNRIKELFATNAELGNKWK